MTPIRPFKALAVALLLALTACSEAPPPAPVTTSAPAAPTLSAPATPRFAGTTEPFAAHPVYFLVTDRFANGDPANDQRDQGGEHRSFDIPLTGPDGKPYPDPEGVVDNIGYQGGDFRGVLDHAAYIREMGFGAVWITPIIENPDQAFTGGDPITPTSFLSDRGKAAYHGYWGINFYRLDEHLPSADLDFRDFTRAMGENGLKVVLDVVANHGSPAWSMPTPQAQFGKLYDREGQLIADHQNLPPEQLDPANPLHQFYRREKDLAQLSDLDYENPAVIDYLTGAYLQWIEQGAAALRLDTLKHVPLSTWKQISDRIRAEHPGMFMFGEAFDYSAEKIAAYTWPENGGISVLDFPMKEAMRSVFGQDRKGYETLAPTLFLESGPYQNVYELTTFYDNHDVPRLNASDAGFIDAHHWIFTTRGIPVIYYGSETGFMRGRAEHSGNRNYYGAERIEAGRTHPIREALVRIGRIRAGSLALQRGLQVMLELQGDRAAFYRVYEGPEGAETALVLLNKGATPTRFEITDQLQAGNWQSADADAMQLIAAGAALIDEVPAHGASVWIRRGRIEHPELIDQLNRLQSASRRNAAPPVAAAASGS
ncbi:MAG: alpha-amylase family glycosyl hydrolase [Xanthomonadales bacterium]|jgi:cyclomaltodextrin glucanotransferase|nr:alpha-amylase family glycosyl hydrolase [Xanthomonadales bacterium]